MSFINPQKPANVPENLTTPTSSYKRHAWLAMMGLLSFIGAYLALTGYFIYKTFYFFNSASGGDRAFLSIVFGIVSAFLSVFMVKALFFYKKNGDVGAVEVTEKEQPDLFRLINEIADEVGAPRANKVFISHSVNACVFYDLNFFNLLFPSKKNLEIGLGLVNALNTSELKAVLAHEFGHFAQKTMMIGRWVYVSNQIAQQIIGKRDALDRFLSGLSSFDVRIAWIGWGLQIFIWSVRAVAETIFRLVLVAERALSREMEFQADLVAVSLTGSDALIQGLYKLNAADNSLNPALDYAWEKIHEGKKVEDMFAIQTQDIELMRTVLGNEDYAHAPDLPPNGSASNRIFNEGIAQPPTMWLTHPSNVDRENNAKNVYLYVPQVLDSAWAVFKNPELLRKKVTEKFLSFANPEKKVEEVLSEDQVATDYAQRYRAKFLDKKFKGLYLNREVFKGFQSAEEIVSDTVSLEECKRKVLEAYPDKLKEELEELRLLEEEKVHLQGINDRILDAPGGVIQHRGKQLKRKDLPKIVASVDKEIAELDKHLDHFFKENRSAFYTISKSVSERWAEYYSSLIVLLHYTEHSRRNLIDVKKVLNNVYMHVVADGRVSSSEMRDLLTACNRTHSVLAKIYNRKNELMVNKQVAEHLSGDTWSDSLGKFDLPVATNNNIDKWINVIDGWVNVTLSSLNELKTAGLEEMLRIEEIMSDYAKTGVKPVEFSPEALMVPGGYNVLLPGKERKIKEKLGAWDKFYTADGIGATLFRLGIASSIIWLTVYGSNLAVSSDVYLYNGLQRNVTVNYGSESFDLSANAFEMVHIDEGDQFVVLTESGDTIQTYTPEFETGSFDYVFNVAGAASMIEYTVYYGAKFSTPPSDVNRGAAYWIISDVDYIFKEPPKSISTSSSYETRTALLALGESSPVDIAYSVSDSIELVNMAIAHVEWDEEHNGHFEEWVRYVPKELLAPALERRIERNPFDISSLRYQQEVLEGDDLKKALLHQRQLSEENPENGDLRYLVIRGLEDDEEKRKLFIKHFEKYKTSPWFCNGAGYSFMENKNWPKALEAFEVVYGGVAGLQASSELMVERLSRICGRGTYFTRGHVPTTGYMKFVLQLEGTPSMEFRESPYMAYAYLKEGRFEEALNAAKGAQIESQIIRMVAASYGPPISVKPLFENLAPQDGLTSTTLYCTIGYLISEGKSIADYKGQLLEYTAPEDLPSVVEFISAVEAKDLEKAIELEASLKVNTVLRCELYHMARIVFWDKTPEEWVAVSEKGLFANEKVYFP